MEPSKIITSTIDGKEISFYCQYPDDHINQVHLAGNFYEFLELKLLKRMVPAYARILEVGANIGNHVIFYAKYMNPQSITWIEPNLISCEVLNKNVIINNIEAGTTIIGHPGIALSDVPGKASINFYPKNIGGARVEMEEDGLINVLKGDDLLNGNLFDFIKLDTEIQDIEALKGLREIVLRSQPLIFIEIFDSRKSEFLELLDSLRYQIVLSTKRYKLNSNYIIAPKK